ncbi:DUF2637 domain-containing protein [Kitasatospora acidiphila]|uniref:DUF2637 domain-containing protein n=1 Tax=Kitasatospora acidiphila TaxID=2567942 RepID=A0A540W8G9_9ACTN|nr:DUF2637 domain-containing protein [Kitasatospora acidiphila]TQF05320.1 DUF2637 domain-containing protein [Kitasatospora acidiphila]
MARPSLTRAHRALLGVVAVGACLISGIGFAGSYSAVQALAMHKGFGAFSYAFPIGVDAGIVVLLALDLVLTWLRIPFPLLRQAAWLLTVATISFNAAASWGDPLGMGMHAVIPVLFVVVVEASRHAVGRIAAISADRHMESVRLMRWLLSPLPTFRMWRRMQLWELRSYDEVVRLEQNRLVYRAQLRFRYGRGWRRAAPIQALLPLKLAKFGVPLDVSVLERMDPQAVPAAVPAAPAPAVEREAVELESADQEAVQPEAGADPRSQAAAVGPTLAKLAAARWRDGQPGPEPVAQPEPAVRQQAAAVEQPVPSRPGRPVAALRDIRAQLPVDAAAGQEAAGGPGQHQPGTPAAAAGERPAGQPSPWFSARPAAEAEAPVATAQPAHPAQPSYPYQQGGQAPAMHPAAPAAAMTPQAEQASRPQPTVAQLLALAENRGQAPVAEQPELDLGAEPAPAPQQQARAAHTGPVPQPGAPQGAAPQPAPRPAASAAPLADNVFAPRVPVSPQEEEPAGSRRELTVDLAVEALMAYQEDKGHDPDEERLAHYLFTEYGVTGRRPGAPASRGEMARIWPYLQDRYATLGRD